MKDRNLVALSCGTFLLLAPSHVGGQQPDTRLPLTSHRGALLLLRDNPEVATEAALLRPTTSHVLAEQAAWQRLSRIVDASPDVLKTQHANLNPKRHHFIYEWEAEAGRNPQRAGSELLETFLQPKADWSFVAREKEWDSNFDAVIDVFLFSRRSVEGREARFAAQELVSVFKRHLHAAAAKAPTRLSLSVRLPDYGYDFPTRSIRFQPRSAAGEGLTLLQHPEEVRFFEWVLPPSARSTANYALSGTAGTDAEPPTVKPGIDAAAESPTKTWRSFTGATGSIPQIELVALDRQLRLTSIPLDPAIAERLAKADHYATMGRMTGLTAIISIDADRVELGERTIEGTQRAKYGVLFARIQKVDIIGPGPKFELLASFAPDSLPAPSPARSVETTAIPKSAPAAGESLKDRQARQAQMDKEDADLRNSVVEELRRKAMAAQAAAGAEQAAAMAQASSPSPGCVDSSPSKPSQDVVNVEFVNVSKHPRKLHWVNFGGMRQTYGALQPGQRLALQTYVAHRWAVTDLADTCLAVLLISKNSSRLEVR